MGVTDAFLRTVSTLTAAARGTVRLHGAWQGPLLACDLRRPRDLRRQKSALRYALSVFIVFCLVVRWFGFQL